MTFEVPINRPAVRRTRPGSKIAMALRAMLKSSIALGFAVLMSGCVLSVEPVIPESAATFDTRLLGTWEHESDSDRAVISRAAEKMYSIEYTSGSTVTRFEARLGRLGERLVLDAWPTPTDGDLPDSYSGTLIGGHVLFLLEITTDEIRIATLEPDSLIAAFRANQVSLAHEYSEDRLILLGTTEELRAALGAYFAQRGALGETDVWRHSQGTQRAGPTPVPCFEASPWREADQLFHRDSHWLGADGASSVDLGDGRILWLFGDSWIDSSGSGTRRGAHIVSNSLAIQVGADPSNASIRFYWGLSVDGSPAAFFPDHGDKRRWLGNAVRIEDRLVLFFNQIISTNTGIGFESVGWTAVMVENPDAEPSAWRVVPLETPANPLGVLVGFAAVLRLDEYVYAFGSEDPVKSHPVYVVRWPVEDVRRGNLLQPEWWAGERLAWVPDSSSTPRLPVFENGQSELTIHFDEATKRFLEVQTTGFGPADVAMRAAPNLTGPWTAPQLMYRPSEYYRPNVMIYSAKAHPELAGGDLVLTYDTNTFQFNELLTDSLIYYPRFVRLTRCR